MEVLESCKAIPLCIFENNVFFPVILSESTILFAVHDDSIMNLEEAVSAVDGRLTAVNFTLSIEIQDVDTGLTALGDTVAELEGRMENLEGELTSIEELISELEGRLTKLEVAGTLALTNNYYKMRFPFQSENSVVYIYIYIYIYIYHLYLLPSG